MEVRSEELIVTRGAKAESNLSTEDSQELERLMDEVQHLSVEIRAKLKQMDKDNKEFVKSGGDASSSESRIRLNMHGEKNTTRTSPVFFLFKKRSSTS